MLTTTAALAAATDAMLFAAPLAPRSGHLAGLLRPFARRPHVFVAEDAAATRVTIHKTGALDVEIEIATATRRWTACVRDLANGAELTRLAGDYRGAATDAAEVRTAMLGDLHTLLAAVVDPALRLTSRPHRVEVATAAGWRPLPCFA